jgi:hypothetical protein
MTTMMDNNITPEDLYHNDTGLQQGPGLFFCHRADMTISAGIFLGDFPLDYSFPLFLYQITVIFVSTRLVHGICRNFGLPIVISQLIVCSLFPPFLLLKFSCVQCHNFECQNQC